VIGWANLSLLDGRLQSEVGYVAKAPPKERIFSRELEAELERMRGFLKSTTATPL